MKRCLIILLTLISLFTLTVFPAFAAENQEYVFLSIPVPEGQKAYISLHEGRVPEGVYDVYAYAGGELVLSSLSPFSVVYSTEYEGYPASISSVEFSGVDPFNSYGIVVADAFDAEGYTGLSILMNGYPISINGSMFKLVPSGNTMIGLSDIVSSDVLSGVLDNVISLLPAVLVLIVAYIAIRKGIGFVRDFLHAA